MVRVIGFYRWKEGAYFDHKYYGTEHMRLTKDALASHGLYRLESDHFISAQQPEPGEIIAASHAYFPSFEVAQAAITNVGAVIMSDVFNYTNLKPEIRFSVVSSHL